MGTGLVGPFPICVTLADTGIPEELARKRSSTPETEEHCQSDDIIILISLLRKDN